MPCTIESSLLACITLLLLGSGTCALVAGRLRGAKGDLAALLSRLGPRRQTGDLGPRRLGPYTLVDKLGQGGMAQVYRAWHPTLRRWCALKLLGRDASERERARFEKEVQVTAQLCHPNTVTVYDYGRAVDGTCYYAMELLDGMTLQELVERHGPQAPGRVIQILLQLCAALREAHGVGLIHRDIKPDNVLLCKKGSMTDAVKLFDFGLVKEVASEPSISQSMNRVMGTPLYMSPEAIRAPEAVSARSDLYGLGAVAYFLLTGSPVFDGRNIVEVCSHHLHSAPKPMSLVAGWPIAEDLEGIVLECLAKDPEDRPVSAAELARRLSRCEDASSWARAHAERWWQNPTRFRPSARNVIECRFRALDDVLRDHRACA